MSHSRKSGRSAWANPHGDSGKSSPARSAVPPHLRGTSAASSPSIARPSSLSSTRGPNSQATTQPAPSSNTSRPLDESRSFSCPFQGCDLSFATNALLIKHKASPASGHDYCKLCDLDFVDDDAHHIHKMSSEKHITCHICSEDFRSEAGCKRHMSQMHATQQNIKCRGCSKLFLQGAALMSHIEKSQCPVIHKAEFETQRAMVALTMEHITRNGVKADAEIQVDQFDPLEPSLPNAKLQGGGVSLAGLSLVDHDEALDGIFTDSSSPVNRTYADKFPVLGGEPKGKGVVRPIRGQFSILGSEPKEKQAVKPAVSQFPSLESKPKEKEVAKPITSHLGEEDQGHTWAKRIFLNATPTPPPPEWVSPASEFEFRSAINPLNGQRSHFRLADIKRDPYTGMFHCPMNKCDAGPYPTLDLLEGHLGSGVHKGVSNRCVGCLRIFKSPSALTAHMESSSERCRVRESRHFGNALNLVSGGYLGVNGRHADGSVKIDTPESPMPIIW